MIVVMVILNVLAIASACYFFFRSKSDYSVIFFVLSMVCMHLSGAYIVVKGTEARLGEPLFEGVDEILPPDRVYFQVTCLTGMYEQPDASSRRILELRKRTVVYAYGTRDGWVRVRMTKDITGQKAPNTLHAIGWVPMCDVKHYPKQRLNILVSLVQQVYGLTDFLLDCLQIVIGVSVVMLFYGKRRAIVVITAAVFLVLSCLHAIYLFRRFFAVHAVRDVEFLNITLFYVVGIGLAIALSSLVTKRVVKWVKHRQIQKEKHRKKEKCGQTEELLRLQEEELWLQVQKSPTQHLCKNYLARFPNGRYVVNIKNVLKKFESIEKRFGTKTSLHHTNGWEKGFFIGLGGTAFMLLLFATSQFIMSLPPILTVILIFTPLVLGFLILFIRHDR